MEGQSGFFNKIPTVDYSLSTLLERHVELKETPEIKNKKKKKRIVPFLYGEGLREEIRMKLSQNKDKKRKLFLKNSGNPENKLYHNRSFPSLIERKFNENSSKLIVSDSESDDEESTVGNEGERVITLKTQSERTRRKEREYMKEIMKKKIVGNENIKVFKKGLERFERDNLDREKKKLEDLHGNRFNKNKFTFPLVRNFRESVFSKKKKREKKIDESLMDETQKKKEKEKEKRRKEMEVRINERIKHLGEYLQKSISYLCREFQEKINQSKSTFLFEESQELPVIKEMLLHLLRLIPTISTVDLKSLWVKGAEIFFFWQFKLSKTFNISHENDIITLAVRYCHAYFQNDSILYELFKRSNDYRNEENKNLTEENLKQLEKKDQMKSDFLLNVIVDNEYIKKKRQKEKEDTENKNVRVSAAVSEERKRYEIIKNLFSENRIEQNQGSMEKFRRYIHNKKILYVISFYIHYCNVYTEKYFRLLLQKMKEKIVRMYFPIPSSNSNTRDNFERNIYLLEVNQSDSEMEGFLNFLVDEDWRKKVLRKIMEDAAMKREQEELQRKMSKKGAHYNSIKEAMSGLRKVVDEIPDLKKAQIAEEKNLKNKMNGKKKKIYFLKKIRMNPPPFMKRLSHMFINIPGRTFDRSTIDYGSEENDGKTSNDDSNIVLGENGNFGVNKNSISAAESKEYDVDKRMRELRKKLGMDDLSLQKQGSRKYSIPPSMNQDGFLEKADEDLKKSILERKKMKRLNDLEQERKAYLRYSVERTVDDPEDDLSKQIREQDALLKKLKSESMDNINKRRRMEREKEEREKKKNSNSSEEEEEEGEEEGEEEDGINNNGKKKKRKKKKRKKGKVQFAERKIHFVPERKKKKIRKKEVSWSEKKQDQEEKYKKFLKIQSLKSKGKIKRIVRNRKKSDNFNEIFTLFRENKDREFSNDQFFGGSDQNSDSGKKNVVEESNVVNKQIKSEESSSVANIHFLFDAIVKREKKKEERYQNELELIEDLLDEYYGRKTFSGDESKKFVAKLITKFESGAAGLDEKLIIRRYITLLKDITRDGGGGGGGGKIKLKRKEKRKLKNMIVFLQNKMKICQFEKTKIDENLMIIQNYERDLFSNTEDVIIPNQKLLNSKNPNLNGFRIGYQLGSKDELDKLQKKQLHTQYSKYLARMYSHIKKNIFSHENISLAFHKLRAFQVKHEKNFSAKHRKKMNEIFNLLKKKLNELTHNFDTDDKKAGFLLKKMEENQKRVFDKVLSLGDNNIISVNQNQKKGKLLKGRRTATNKVSAQGSRKILKEILTVMKLKFNPSNRNKLKNMIFNVMKNEKKLSLNKDDEMELGIIYKHYKKIEKEQIIEEENSYKQEKELEDLNKRLSDEEVYVNLSMIHKKLFALGVLLDRKISRKIYLHLTVSLYKQLRNDENEVLFLKICDKIIDPDSTVMLKQKEEDSLKKMMDVVKERIRLRRIVDEEKRKEEKIRIEIREKIAMLLKIIRKFQDGISESKNSKIDKFIAEQEVLSNEEYRLVYQTFRTFFEMKDDKFFMFLKMSFKRKLLGGYLMILYRIKSPNFHLDDIDKEIVGEIYEAILGYEKDTIKELSEKRKQIQKKIDISRFTGDTKIEDELMNKQREEDELKRKIERYHFFTKDDFDFGYDDKSKFSLFEKEYLYDYLIRQMKHKTFSSNSNEEEIKDTTNKGDEALGLLKLKDVSVYQVIYNMNNIWEDLKYTPDEKYLLHQKYNNDPYINDAKLTKKVFLLWKECSFLILKREMYLKNYLEFENSENTEEEIDVVEKEKKRSESYIVITKMNLECNQLCKRIKELEGLDVKYNNLVYTEKIERDFEIMLYTIEGNKLRDTKFFSYEEFLDELQ